jgi:hypothetical protein
MPRARRFLLVAPSEMSTGEAVTLVNIAQDLERGGASCTFITSGGARRYIESAFPDRLQSLGGSLRENQRLWTQAIEQTRPDAIIFADYPLLFFSSGSVPLADDAWVGALERTGAALFTLDHLGYAQRQRIVAFGPPHMTFSMEVTPALPPPMQVLLPCPINDPGPVPDRRGRPFRCGVAQQISEAQRLAVRASYLDDEQGLLVLHTAPGWAAHLARDLGLPHYRFLSELLAEMLAGLQRQVVVVSVHAEGLLAPVHINGFRAINVPPMRPDEFERLIAASDLMLTDNAISVSLGKAVSLGVPCALLANGSAITELQARRGEPGARWACAIEQERPGAIFPWEVFPIWNRDDLDHLGFGDEHAFRRCTARLETFGGDATRARVVELLGGGPVRKSTGDARHEYMRRMAELPTASQVLATALA